VGKKIPITPNFNILIDSQNLLRLDDELKKINTYVEEKPLGDRMKEYESLTRFKLSKEYPMIIRLDGNAFHTFTRGFEKPFDKILREAMEETAKFLLENIPGSQCAYHQSDEISILVTNYQLSNREPWFDNNINKIVSITSSMATLAFNRSFLKKIKERIGIVDYNEARIYAEDSFVAKMDAIENGALFDSRVFILPKDEVVNYFIWRQQDAIKNSISMVAQSLFSHKSLQGLNGPQMIKRMKDEKGIDYDKKYTVIERRGSITHRLKPMEQTKVIRMKNGIEKEIRFTRSNWGIDDNIPVFKDERDYIEKFI
jgi:tRNA(His) 5'-end guanylyltransferase